MVADLQIGKSPADTLQRADGRHAPEGGQTALAAPVMPPAVQAVDWIVVERIDKNKAPPPDGGSG